MIAPTQGLPWYRRSRRPVRTSLSLGNATFLVLVCLGCAVSVPVIVDLIYGIQTRIGAVVGAVVVFLFLATAAVWLYLLAGQKVLQALGLLLLLLNITGRADEVVALNAFSTLWFDQKLSVTTALILLLFLSVLVLGKRNIRPQAAGARRFETWFLAFAVLLTTSQFINHDPRSAVLLSVGGVWQYVALFYVMAAAVSSTEDARGLLRYLVWTVFVSIAFRLAVRGEGFFVLDPTGFRRLSSLSFGSEDYYSGYVLLVLIIALYLLRTANSLAARVGWAVASVGLTLELANTFTRGALMSLLFIPSLALWRRERRFVVAILATVVIVGTIAYGPVMEILTYREIYFDRRLLDVPGVSARLWLYGQALPHFFDRFGWGYGIGRYMMFSDATQYDGRELPVHSMTMELAQMTGAWTTLMFLAMFGWLVRGVWRLGRNSNEPHSILARYCLLGLTVWFTFANTTSLSILCYTPYEATTLMYVVLFTAALIPEYAAKAKANDVRKHQGSRLGVPQGVTGRRPELTATS
jgi:O-antigen ligase